jgi:tetratricopeptide (TPR) repeat protein
MAPSPLKDVDVAERAQLLKIVVFFSGPCFIILTALWVFLKWQGAISATTVAILEVCNIPLTAVGVWAIHRGTTRAASGFARTVLAGGNIPPPPSYPRQETLIVRGQYAEAADYFRDHLRVSPGDLEARLRLADLLERHLAGYDEAERLYVDVRREQPDPRQEMAAYNGLIDLYAKTGRRDRLKVELARFAERYRGSPQAEEAARRLAQIKAEDSPTSGSPRSPT